MLTLKITDNVPDVIKFVKDLDKQIGFATANALNKTATKVQQFTLTNLLPSKFTLRAKNPGAPWQKPGMKMGFNIKFANRNNLQAVLGSQADFLKLQEEGGDKTL